MMWLTYKGYTHKPKKGVFVKKLVNTKLVLLFFFSCALSILPMDLLPDKYKLVSFEANDGIVHIEKKNIPLIGALYERYDLYKKSKYKNDPIVIPLLKGFFKEDIVLVNDALNARPDTFATYFKELKEDKRDNLIKISMPFKSDDAIRSLYVPEITKRILSICLAKDVCNNVMKFFPNTEKDDLIFHCRKQLIKNKSSLGLVKQPRQFANFEYLAGEIDLHTLFINGYFDGNTVKRPIPLRIGDKIYKTYVYNFVSPYLEYRITEQPKNKNSSDYLVWVIDHKNPDATFAEPIQHNSPIIGCCFSKTKTNIEYVITYSEDDINFSTISMFKDGFSDIKTVRVDTASKGKNVAAAYCNTNNRLLMGMYQGIDNIFIDWDMDGTPSPQPSRWPFKQYGLLEKIIIKKNKVYEEEAFTIYGSCGKYNVHKWKDLGNIPWVLEGITSLSDIVNYIYGYFFERNNEIFMYDYSPSPFFSIEKAEKHKQQSSVWYRWTQGLIDDFNFMPDDECYKKYSSSGEFILSNSLKKESGMLYVKTELLDPATHKSMLSIDTLYNNFFVVGFDNEETKLIFLHNNINNAEVLLWDEQDKKAMEWFADHALGNLGIISLLTRLLEEIKKKNEIVLKESDPICIMLRDWVKESPHALACMQKCFPLRAIK